MDSRLWRTTCVALVLLQPSATVGAKQERRVPPLEVRIELIAGDCEEGLRAVVESEILKSTKARITTQGATHRLLLSCHWQQSPAGSTSFYSSWGNADLTIRVEEIADESTVYSESFTEGAKSRGLAMKGAAQLAVADLLRAKVFPKK